MTTRLPRPIPVGFALNLTLGIAAVLATTILAAQGTDAKQDDTESASLPALTDIDGRVHNAPTQSGREAPVIVLVWSGAECPLARLYLPRLKRLASEAPSSVRVYLVNSNSHDDLADIRNAVGEVPEKLAVIRDSEGRLAKIVGARTTTEALVFDRDRRLVYRGAFDDQYGFRRDTKGGGPRTYRKEAPTREFVKEAIKAALAGTAPNTRVTEPLGCTLEWSLPPAPPRTPTVATDETAGGESSITFHQHIAPLLNEHCAPCHRKGGNAPFAVGEYREVYGWRAMIRDVVEERRMPPWGAAAGYGPFSNDHSLSDEQIARVLSWVDSGARPGRETPSLPAPNAFGSGFGKADAELRVPRFEVPAEGTLPYRYVRITTEFKEDRWIQAMEVRSTAAQVVHHVLVFVDKIPPAPAGSQRPWRPRFDPLQLLEGAKRKDIPKWIKRFRKYATHDLLVGQAGGLDGYLVSSASSGASTIYPEGRAKLLPAGATLAFQIHYTPNGTAQTDETVLALRFAETPPKEPIDTGAISTVAFQIPPHAASHQVEATDRFLRDGLLLSMRPHMHLRGKAFRYVAEYPDGRKETLLNVPRYDFDWQLDYVFETPRLLPKGTILRGIATFDNSGDNPYNPDPDQEVYFGLQTFEEMMIGYYDVIWLDPDSSVEITGETTPAEASQEE